MRGQGRDGQADWASGTPPSPMLIQVATLEEGRKADDRAERAALAAMLGTAADDRGATGLGGPCDDADAVYGWLDRFAEGDFCRRLAALAGADVQLAVRYQRTSRDGLAAGPWLVRLWLLPGVGMVAHQHPADGAGPRWTAPYRKHLIRSAADLARSLEPAAVRVIAEAIQTGDVWQTIWRQTLGCPI